MPMAEDPNQLCESFLRYVTGRMSEGEALSFEERLLSDHALSDAAAVCEQELIDRYAAGELNEADRTALQTWIEASPRRMQRVRLAQSLLAFANDRVQHRSGMRFVLPIAALIAGLAVLTWMTGKHFRDNAGSVSQTAAQNGASSASEKTPQRNGLATPANQVILVVAERVRGERPPQPMTVPRDSSVTLQVLLPEGAANSSYRLRVTKANAQSPVLDDRGVKPVATGDRLYLIAHVSAGVLMPGLYTIDVDGAEESFLSQVTLRE